MPSWDLVAWTLLLTANAHCGELQAAQEVFDLMPDRDILAWNAMLAALAQQDHGESFRALELMCLDGVNPNEFSFLNVLLACSHIGVLVAARYYFLAMAADHCLAPLKAHYLFVADLLGRSGLLYESEELIHSMPFAADDVAWGSLLGSCNVHLDEKRAARAAEKIVKLNPDISSPYVLLSNICMN
ncbi:hypothetical protein SELMODRAFT_105014 [Selaginella moellendorffii]|uniref:Pentatricopeptide repeat-containing protein n=2 Tax=Selaginella moellendorffii TaxID=88036 RepID=D8RYX8_SELML|nr:hypothetical protein SELMODRAFT_105014 [Selaginella moellendorffii]